MKPYYEQDGITIYHGECRALRVCPSPSGCAPVTAPKRLPVVLSPQERAMARLLGRIMRRIALSRSEGKAA